jgi:hypothetical protein
VSELPKPDYARNMKLIGHSDQGGRPDGVQVMVHRGFAYVGHMFSKGFSVIDVRDPKTPRAMNYLAAPPNGGAPSRCEISFGFARSATSITTIPASRHAA